MHALTAHINSELLNETSSGNEQAFARLVTPLFGQLFGFALQITKSRAVAEEIVQDVFMQIWNHRRELPSIDNLQAWIFTIARNKALTAFQQQLNNPRALKAVDDFFALAPGSAEDQVLLKESQALIGKAVAALPEQQAAVFTKSRLEHRSLDEIARELQISKETVKKHLTRSLRTVRAFLDNQHEPMVIIYCWFIYHLFV